MKKFFRPILLIIALALCFSAVVYAAGTESPTALIAENLDITTYRGVSVGGKLSARGGQGELRYEIVTPPGKGSIDLSEDGSFVYTPDEGRKGKDYFGYKAYDSQGTASQEATVIIRIQKQKSKICYSDMSGNAQEYSAVLLAEKNIFTGECIGGEYLFSPDKNVSRGEFLTMCMELCGTELLSGVSQTGFADDSDIQTWLKPYVSTALSCGLISGYPSQDSSAVFSAKQDITMAEAAVMLDSALGLTDASAAWYMQDEAVPVWACQSAANIAACSIVPSGKLMDSQALTRADAAEMLAGAVKIAGSR